MTRAAEAEQPPTFYGSALDEAELVDALRVDGVDEEIAVLRLELRRRLKDHPEDFALLLRSAALIVRAAAARYRMSPKRAEDLAQSLSETLRRIGAELFPERFGGDGGDA